jgi:hypothetical protein
MYGRYSLYTADMARPVGFEPTTNRFEVCDSIQLSYGRFFRFLSRPDAIMG